MIKKFSIDENALFRMKTVNESIREDHGYKKKD